MTSNHIIDKTQTLETISEYIHYLKFLIPTPALFTSYRSYEPLEKRGSNGHEAIFQIALQKYEKPASARCRNGMLEVKLCCTMLKIF